MANNNRQDEEKRSKKKRIIALLAFLVGALGVSSASIPLFLERYNYHALPDAIKPKVKFSNDHNNGGKLSLELTPELAGKNVTAVFEDEHGNAHLIEDLTVGTDGKLVIDTSKLPKGARYTFKQLHSDSKSGRKALLDLSDVLPKDKTVNKTFYFDDKGDLVFEKNFGKNKAGQKVKVTVKDHNGSPEGTTKTIEVTLDKDGIARIKPSEIPGFENNPNGKYSIEKFEDENGNEISENIATKAENQNITYGKMPIIIDQKNKNDLSKWKLPNETPHDAGTKILVPYTDDKGQKHVAEISVVSQEGSLNGTLNPDEIKNLIPNNAAIDVNNLKLKDANGTITPLNSIPDYQYQHDSHFHDGKLKVYVGKPNQELMKILNKLNLLIKHLIKMEMKRKFPLLKKLIKMDMLNYLILMI